MATMNNLDTVEFDDESSVDDDLSDRKLRTCLTNLNINNIQCSSADILLECLIHQICRYVESDPTRQKQLFIVICDKLHELRLLGKSYRLDELQNLRERYMTILQNLILAAKCLVDNVDRSSGDQEETGPPLDVRIENLRSKLFDWSRYAHEFREMDFIARGGFGQVFRAHNILDDCDYAVKKICLKYQNVDTFVQSLREVQTLARLNHPNIVTYKAAWLEPFDSRKQHPLVRNEGTKPPRIQLIEERIPGMRLQMIEELKSDPKLTSNSFEIEFKDSSASRTDSQVEFRNWEHSEHEKTDTTSDQNQTDFRRKNDGKSDPADNRNLLESFKNLKTELSNDNELFSSKNTSNTFHEKSFEKDSVESDNSFGFFSKKIEKSNETSDLSTNYSIPNEKLYARNSKHKTDNYSGFFHEKSRKSNSFSEPSTDHNENHENSLERENSCDFIQEKTELSHHSDILTNNSDDTSQERNSHESDSDSHGFFNKKTEISHENSETSELSTNHSSHNKTSHVWQNHPCESTSSSLHRGQFGPYNPMKNLDKLKKAHGGCKMEELRRISKENQRETAQKDVIAVEEEEKKTKGLQVTEKMKESKKKGEMLMAVEKRRGGKKEELMAVEKRRESLNYFFPESQTISMDWVTLYIQMQLCQITLKQWLSCTTFETPCPLYDTQVGVIFRQIVQGLDYIHCQGIVHHDIKPSNIFVSHDLKSVQVGDFGLACCLLPHSPHEGGYSLISAPPRTDHPLGTRLYAAPEQLHGLCNPKSDIYSLGIVLFEMLINFSTDMEKSKEITKLKMGHMPPRIDTKYPHYAKIITKLLDVNPKHRPSAGQLLIHLDSNLDEERTMSGDDKDEMIEELKLELDRKREEIETLQRTIRQMEEERR
uniref:non-specific serine/threonine protein kinase n=1 Tax=Cacopsylla melanoneura TaxID=428564 RepID=A0A8D9AMU2_9HEMI